MGNWTKWILGGLGWALGGPIGALLGFFLGKEIGKAANLLQDGEPGNGSRPRGPYRDTGTSADVNVALMVLIAAVMKADGEVRRSELDYVKDFLLRNYGEEGGKQMLSALRELTKQDIDVHAVCRQIKTNTNYVSRYHMVDFLFGLACADGSFVSSEQKMLRLIANDLGINYTDYSSIYYRHAGNASGDAGYASGGSRSGFGTSGSSHKDPYKVLGIEHTASDDEVKKAYRRLAMKYHPDKVSGLGEEQKKNAEAQFREINEAYERIKAERGMK